MPLPSSSGQLPDQSVPVCISYKIGTTSDLSGRPVDSGEAFSSYDVDFTVKVEAKGLKADTKYFYQFSDCTNLSITSPIGATRTLANSRSKSTCNCNKQHFLKLSIPAPAKEVNGGKPLTFAIFSCSQFQAGERSTQSLYDKVNSIIQGGLMRMDSLLAILPLMCSFILETM